MLLHCEGARVRPPCSTGSKGEPVATIARPSVQLYASAGVISQEEVGLERGKTMGRSCAAAIARIAASGGGRGRGRARDGVRARARARVRARVRVRVRVTW